MSTKPVCYFRFFDGEPDWAEDCVSPDDTCADGYEEGDQYEAVPLYRSSEFEARIATLEAELLAARDLLAGEREACAEVAERWGEAHGAAVTVNARNAGRKIAIGIRGQGVTE